VGSVCKSASQPDDHDPRTRADKVILLRTNISGSPSFRQLVTQVQEKVSEALFQTNTSLDHSLMQLPSSRDGHTTLLPQVIFSFQSWIREPGSHFSAFTVSGLKYELYFDVDERPEGIIGRLNYNAELFEPATVARMAVHWLTLLEDALADPEQCLSELAFLSAAETHQLLVERNRTSAAYPAVCVHELIEA